MSSGRKFLLRNILREVKRKLMKILICGLCFSVVAMFASPLDVLPKTSNLINRIEGQVYDPNHRPVENVYVELLNEVDSVIQRTKTNSSGRFTFSGVPPGRLTVRVLTFGTNFMEQTQEVVIVQTRNSNDVDYVDISLRYDKRNRATEPDMPTGATFVQDFLTAARPFDVK